MRIGLGFDVHSFSPGRRLVLGGVEIPHDAGLAGHSDADVVLHAVMDAMLGALALGDIGQHFPNTDPTYAGADSLQLLAHVNRLVQQEGYRMENLDVMILAEAPKVMPYAAAMREQMARVLGSDVGQISVKATTMEGMGFIGHKEGIAAQAVVLLEAAQHG